MSNQSHSNSHLRVNSVSFLNPLQLYERERTNCEARSISLQGFNQSDETQTWLGTVAVAKTFQDALKKINLQIVSYHSIFKSSTHMTTCLVVAFPFISSTNPLLIPRETHPKRILVRESKAQMWKIHPFSSFYYHTIILSSTLSVSIVCNSP